MGDWLNVVSVFANLVLAFVAIVALVMTMKQAGDNQRQFLENQRQAKESFEAGKRPFLFPDDPLSLITDNGGSLLFNFDELDNFRSPITVKNGGTGLAFNVRGVLMQPRIESDLGIRPGVRSFALHSPLPVGQLVRDETVAGPTSFGWDTTVDNNPEHTLSAPVGAIARLTLTYQDIFGRTLASQFDYVTYRTKETMWEFRGLFTEHVRSIAEIQREFDYENLRIQRAFQARGE